MTNLTLRTTAQCNILMKVGENYSSRIEPTFVKITCFQHYTTVNEHKQITVFKHLFIRNVKTIIILNQIPFFSL